MSNAKPSDVPVEDREAFNLTPVAEPGNRPAVYHKSPAACAFNAAYDEMEKKYPKRKDQKKEGIDLAVVGWKAVDALIAAAYARGEEVEGVLIEANEDDGTMTPADVVRSILADRGSLRALLKEARGYVAGRFVPSNGASGSLLARIDAALAGGA